MSIRTRQQQGETLSPRDSVVDAAAIVAILVYICSLLPVSVFFAGPATGGDMGSHYWPFHALLHHGLPEWRLRMWNPGNLAGEPLFLQYFPLPFLLMAFLTLFVSAGTAFSIGTALPFLAFPLSVYLSLRLLRLPSPAPLLGMAASLLFLFNESYVMWGGNAMSILAGQFAHSYALVFFFLALAAFVRDSRAGRFPYAGVVLSVAAGLSHAYVFLGIPFLLAIPLTRREGVARSFVRSTAAGVVILLLLLWFIVPMIGNSAWTTDFSYRWQSSSIVLEAMPLHILMTIAGGFACAAHLTLLSKAAREEVLEVCRIFGLPILGFIGFYFLFPHLQLIDVRALPQVSCLLLVASGVFIGLWIRERLSSWRDIASCAVCLVIIVVTDSFIRHFPTWAEWNYSGWGAKPLYDPLIALSRNLEGDFNQPRVVYEHNLANQAAGSERVFEMLPYFSGRATLESVYHYASLISPAAFHLQAELSKTPSCPFPQYKCPAVDYAAAVQHAGLLGVGAFIVTDEELKNRARSMDALHEDGTFGPWTVFQLRKQPELVEVPRGPLYPVADAYWQGRLEGEASIGTAFWKEAFFRWFVSYSPETPFMYTSFHGNSAVPLQGTSKPCRPELRVEFNRIRLYTDCPGYPHVLKFSYHGDWRASSGDPLFAVSPGFIGLVPSATNLTLEFGGGTSWKVSGYVSLITAIVFLVFAVRAGSRRFSSS